MTNFKFYGIRERLIFSDFATRNQNIIKNYSLTPWDGKEKYDGKIQTNKSKYIIELKIRQYSAYQSFNSDQKPNWLIQKDKYTSLIELSKDFGLDALYICGFTDGIVIWNLNDIGNEIEWRIEKYNKTKGTAKIEKEVGDLYISQSLAIYNYSIDIEEYNKKSQIILDYYNQVHPYICSEYDELEF